MTRALWLNTELIGIPDDARVMYPHDDTNVAIVAWPEWRAAVVMAGGGVIEVEAEVERNLLRAYFGAD